MRTVAVVATACLLALASACTPIVERRTTASTIADVALALAVVTPVPFVYCDVTDSGGREAGCFPQFMLGAVTGGPLLIIAALAGLATLRPFPPPPPPK